MLYVKLVSPTELVYEGNDILFIKARTTKGDVGILTNHTNYVAALGAGNLLLRKENKEEMNYIVTGGFLEFKDNKAIIIAEDIIDASKEKDIRLERELAIQKAKKEKLKESQDILGTKKRIQDSLKR